MNYARAAKKINQEMHVDKATICDLNGSTANTAKDADSLTTDLQEKNQQLIQRCLDVRGKDKQNEREAQV